MTVRSLGSKVPTIAASAWVSEAAYVVGDVVIGEGSSIWPGAVLRGDFCKIRIGARTHIEDNCVVHSGDFVDVGDDVLVGHSVVLHCRSVGNNCLLANHATVLDDAVIGDLCLVAAGAVLLPGTVVPDGSFVSGVPATVRPARQEHIDRLRMQNRTDVGYGAMLLEYKNAGL